MTHQPPNAVYCYNFMIPRSAIDENGHVNNVSYVQWMQEAAMKHFEFLGGVTLMRAVDGTWFVHSHKIEYLLPAFEGEEIEVRTWIENVRRVRSLRKYEFVRQSDGKVLVKGETDWVFINAKSGRPMAIPDALVKIFPLVSKE
jgi:acyl-CoA thioester hydrolase